MSGAYRGGAGPEEENGMGWGGLVPTAAERRAERDEAARRALLASVVAQRDELAKALHAAATSLETVSILSGRATYGKPPIETHMSTFMEVRAYAAARAKVARESIDAAAKAYGNAS